MKIFIYAYFFLFITLGFAQGDNPLLADPTIFQYKGTYYLYGTKGAKNVKGEGFQVFTSTDMKNWKKPAGDGFAFKKGDGYGDTGFWAPQVFEYNGTFYMAYTANEQIAIATAKSPLGPFKNDSKPLVSDVRQIDPFIFFDNGKVYMYHVRLDKGNRIFVAEMNKDLSGIKTETLKECIHAEKGWEDTESVQWTVTEGPTVFKKGSTYFMIYSANDFRNKDYAVGYATADNPYGPWKKATDSPFISQKQLKEPGTGHGDIFYDKKRNMYYVFHTHFSDKEVAPRKTAVVPVTLKGNRISIQKNKSLVWLVLQDIY
jgi:xylan 1,4-beta-xylosidase